MYVVDCEENDLFGYDAGSRYIKSICFFMCLLILSDVVLW